MMFTGDPPDRASRKFEFASLVEKVLRAARQARAPEPGAGTVRQHHRDDVRHALREQGQQLHAAPAVQMQLRHHEIGCAGLDARDGGTGLLGFTDDFHAVECAEQRGHTAPYRECIVDEKNTQGGVVEA